MRKQSSLTFEDIRLAPALIEKLQETGITAPTPIQMSAIPALLAGRDAVMVSPTGSGKTLAYLLPILQRLDVQQRQTQAIVLAPTQELAMQIVREAEHYGEVFGVKTAALIGGAALSRQLERMKTKPALVVGTPGRVREIVSRGKLRLPFVRYVVIDESDRVFLLGGRRDVEFLLRQSARDRQTVFVSATRPDEMRESERQWLTDPWTPEEAGEGMLAGAEDRTGGGLPETIRHWYFMVDRRDKVDLVRRLLRHTRMKPALLFLNDIEKIGELTAKLTYEGFRVDALYGETSGRERGDAMRRFRNGRIDLLIATDLAARGIDVPGLPLVLQFDPALDADHYVHRAGRTGRMGNEGVSATLVTKQELFIIDKLQKQLNLQMAPKTLYEGRIVSPEEASAARQKSAHTTTDTSKKSAHAATEASKKPANTATDTSKKSSRQGAVKQQPNTRKSKASRERDRKNKGAPRWLKEKRASGPSADGDAGNK